MCVGDITFAPYAAGDDYVDKIGEISFTSTSPTRICLPLDIIDDSFFESNELFTIRLQQTGQPDQTVLVTIISDDPLPATIAVEMSTYSVNEEDGSLSVCIVVNGAQLTAPTTITVTANDITANGIYDCIDLHNAITPPPPLQLALTMLPLPRCSCSLRLGQDDSAPRLPSWRILYRRTLKHSASH